MSVQANDIRKQFDRLKRALPYGDVFLDAALSRLGGGDILCFDASAYDEHPCSDDLGRVYQSGRKDSAAEAVDALIERLPSKVDQYIYRQRVAS